MLMGRNQAVEVIRKTEKIRTGQGHWESGGNNFCSRCIGLGWEEIFILCNKRERGWIDTDPVYRFVAGSWGVCLLLLGFSVNKKQCYWLRGEEATLLWTWSIKGQPFSWSMYAISTCFLECFTLENVPYFLATSLSCYWVFPVSTKTWSNIIINKIQWNKNKIWKTALYPPPPQLTPHFFTCLQWTLSRSCLCCESPSWPSPTPEPPPIELLSELPWSSSPATSKLPALIFKWPVFSS